MPDPMDEESLVRREMVVNALGERFDDLTQEECRALILESDALIRLRCEYGIRLIEEMWSRFPGSRNEESIQLWADAKERLAEMPPAL
jgi:hypothetical protein